MDKGLVSPWRYSADGANMVRVIVATGLIVAAVYADAAFVRVRDPDGLTDDAVNGAHFVKLPNVDGTVEGKDAARRCSLMLEQLGYTFEQPVQWGHVEKSAIPAALFSAIHAALAGDLRAEDMDLLHDRIQDWAKVELAKRAEAAALAAPPEREPVLLGGSAEIGAST